MQVIREAAEKLDCTRSVACLDVDQPTNLVQQRTAKVMRRLPDGIVTLLLTDIVGSSPLWEEHPTAMRAAVARHDDLAGQIVTSHNGFVVKSRGEGDSLFCVFSRATDAVTAALSLQCAFIQEKWPNQLGISVRMAVYTGEAELREGDYRGAIVNRCARIRSAAHGAQILLSLSTADMVSSSLPEGVTLKDLGPHKLTGFRAPEHVYQLLHPELPDRFPTLSAPENPPTNLGRQLTSFVGREAELAAARELLIKNPILTLTGPGGSGKTRLALELADSLLHEHIEFKDGIWFIELAPIQAADLVIPLIGSTVFPDWTGPVTESELVDRLKPKRLLLILDNCEHVVEPVAAMTARLLRGCPNLTVLATSREALSIPGEVLFPVPTLPFPDTGKSHSIKRLHQFESIALFDERARAAQPAFEITAQNAAAVASICKRVDGIPLLIELAAAWVRSLPVAEIADRLDRLPASRGSFATDRHRTFQATMDWSYNLLNEREQTLLRRLSVFSGGWTLEAAESVSHGEGLDEQEILESLSRLVDKSLVTAPSSSTGRYGFLETIRQYALSKLREKQEDEPFQTAHRVYFTLEAQTAKRYLDSGDQQKWLVKLEDDHDNIRAALRNAVDPRDRLEIAVALGRFWYIRGHWSEARGWLEGALSRLPNAAPEVRSDALNLAGIFASAQEDYETAIRLHEECLSHRRSAGNASQIAGSLSNLGSALRQSGHVDRARAHYDEALKLYRDIGDDRGRAMMASNIGNLCLISHDFVTAEGLFRESAQVYESLGDDWYLATALHNLGETLFFLGNVDASEEAFIRGIRVEFRLESAAATANTLTWIAYVSAESGDLERAAVLFAASHHHQTTSDQVTASIEPTGSTGNDLTAKLTALTNACAGIQYADHRAFGASLSLGDAVRFATRIND